MTETSKLLRKIVKFKKTENKIVKSSENVIKIDKIEKMSKNNR